MKKILSIAFAICMIVSIFAIVSVSAATVLTVYKVTIDEPQIGQPLPKNATLPSTASTYVTNVEWKGNLDENGNAMEGEEYTVYVTVRVKDSEKSKYIVESKGNPTVNGKGAGLKNVAKDGKEGVIYYKFNELLSGPLAGKDPITSVSLLIERPTEGSELSYEATPKESQTWMYDIVSVEWQGELDENEKIKKDSEYHGRFRIRLSDQCYSRYFLKNEETSKPYVNGAAASWESISEDGREAVVLKRWMSMNKPEEQPQKKEVVEKVTTDKVPGKIKQTPFAFAGGSGTVADPYLIQTADQLNSIRFGADKHYKLIADIDLSTWGNWVPIGGTEAYGGTMGDQWNKAHAGSVVFTGSLDGNGHVISGMTIKIHDVALYIAEGSNVRYYGLFARINSEGTAIKNLGIINHTIDIEYGTLPTSADLSIGSLASLVTKGNIENCFSAGGKINSKPHNIRCVNSAIRQNTLYGF